MGRRRGFAALNADPGDQDAKRLQVSREAHKAALREQYEAALSLVQQEQHAAARTRLETLLLGRDLQMEQAKDDAFLLRLRYLALRNLAPLLGDSLASLRALQQAASIDSSDAALWAALSRTAGRIGYLGLAVSYANEALARHPGDVMVREWVVYLLAAQGQWEAAGFALQQLGNCEPSHPWLSTSYRHGPYSREALLAVLPEGSFAGLKRVAKAQRSTAAAPSEQQQLNGLSLLSNNPAAGGAETPLQQLLLSSIAGGDEVAGSGAGAAAAPFHVEVRNLQQLGDQVVKLLHKCMAAAGAAGRAAAQQQEAGGAAVAVPMGTGAGNSPLIKPGEALVLVDSIPQQQQEQQLDGKLAGAAGSDPSSPTAAAAVAGEPSAAEPATPVASKQPSAAADQPGDGSKMELEQQDTADLPGAATPGQQPGPGATPQGGRVGLRRRGAGPDAAAAAALPAAAAGAGEAGNSKTDGRGKEGAALYAAEQQVRQLCGLFPGLSVAAVTGSQQQVSAAGASHTAAGGATTAAQGAVAAAQQEQLQQQEAASASNAAEQQLLQRLHGQCLPLEKLAQVLFKELLSLAAHHALPTNLATLLLQLAAHVRVDTLDDEQLLLLVEVHLEALLSGSSAELPAAVGLAGIRALGSSAEGLAAPAAGSRTGAAAGAKSKGQAAVATVSSLGRRARGADAAAAACAARCEVLLLSLQTRFMKAEMQQLQQQGVLSVGAVGQGVGGTRPATDQQQFHCLQQQLLWHAAEELPMPVSWLHAAAGAAAAAGQPAEGIVPGAWRLPAATQQQRQQGSSTVVPSAVAAGCHQLASTGVEPEWGSYTWTPLHKDVWPVLDQQQQGVREPSLSTEGVRTQPEQQKQVPDSVQQQQQQVRELLLRVRALWVQVLLDEHHGRLAEEGRGLATLVQQLNQVQQLLLEAPGVTPVEPCSTNGHGMADGHHLQQQPNVQATGGAAGELQQQLQQQEVVHLPAELSVGVSGKLQGGKLVLELLQAPSASPISAAAAQLKLGRMSVRQQLQQAQQAAQQAQEQPAQRLALAQEAVRLLQPLCGGLQGSRLSADQLQAVQIMVQVAALAAEALREQSMQQQQQQQQGDRAVAPPADDVLQMEALALQAQLLLVQHELDKLQMPGRVVPASSASAATGTTAAGRSSAAMPNCSEQQQGLLQVAALDTTAAAASGARPAPKLADQQTLQALRLISKLCKTASSAAGSAGAANSSVISSAGYSSAAVAKLAAVAQHLQSQQPSTRLLLQQVQAGLLNLLLVCCTHCSDKQHALHPPGAGAARRGPQNGSSKSGAAAGGTTRSRLGGGLSVSHVSWRQLAQEAGLALVLVWQISNSSDSDSNSKSSRGACGEGAGPIVQLLDGVVQVVGRCCSSAANMEALLQLAREWLLKLLREQWGPSHSSPPAPADGAAGEGLAALCVVPGTRDNTREAAAGVAVDTALAQVLYLLYGEQLECPWRGAAFGTSSSSRDGERQLEPLTVAWEEPKGQRVLLEAWGYLSQYSSQRMSFVAATATADYAAACSSLAAEPHDGSTRSTPQQQQQQQQQGASRADNQLVPEQDGEVVQQQLERAPAPLQQQQQTFAVELEDAYWRPCHALLQLLVDQLPEPPEQLLAASLACVQEVLRAPDVDELQILQGHGMLQPLLDRVWSAYDPYTFRDPLHDVHASLYYTYLLSLSEEDGGGDLEELDMVGAGSWEERVQKGARYSIWDLAYNPRRWRSWQFVGVEYDEAFQLLLQQAADRQPPGTWASSPGPQQRLDKVSRRLWRCYLAALELAAAPGACRDEGDVNTAMDIVDRVAKTCWDRAVCCPPLWDGWKAPLKGEAVPLLLRTALHLYHKAEAHLPDEWEYALMRGHLTLQLQAVGSSGSIEGSSSSSSSTSTLAEAVGATRTALDCFAVGNLRAAADSSGGLLQPLLQLHALRLQLLVRAVTAAELEPVAVYCFTPALEQKVRELLEDGAAAAVAQGCEALWKQAATQLPTWSTIPSGSGSSSRGEQSAAVQAWLLLWEDCCSAVAFCQQQYRAATQEHLHLAHYALAEAHWALGRPEAAAKQLQPLFEAGGGDDAAAAGGGRFCIGMCPLPDGNWPEQPAEGAAAQQPHGAAAAAAAGCTASAGATAEGTGAPEADAAATAEAVLLGPVRSCQSSWGHAPSSIRGWGAEEEPRLFYSRLRQCLLLYLKACAAVGDAEALHAAWRWLLPSQGADGAQKGGSKDKAVKGDKRTRDLDHNSRYYLQTKDLGELAAGLHYCWLLQQLLPELQAVALRQQQHEQQRARALEAQQRQRAAEEVARQQQAAEREWQERLKEFTAQHTKVEEELGEAQALVDSTLQPSFVHAAAVFTAGGATKQAAQADLGRLQCVRQAQLKQLDAWVQQRQLAMQRQLAFDLQRLVLKYPLARLSKDSPAGSHGQHQQQHQQQQQQEPPVGQASHPVGCAACPGAGAGLQEAAAGGLLDAGGRSTSKLSKPAWKNVAAVVQQVLKPQGQPAAAAAVGSSQQQAAGGGGDAEVAEAPHAAEQPTSPPAVSGPRSAVPAAPQQPTAASGQQLQQVLASLFHLYVFSCWWPSSEPGEQGPGLEAGVTVAAQELQLLHSSTRSLQQPQQQQQQQQQGCQEQGYGGDNAAAASTSANAAAGHLQGLDAPQQQQQQPLSWQDLAADLSHLPFFAECYVRLLLAQHQQPQQQQQQAAVSMAGSPSPATELLGLLSMLRRYLPKTHRAALKTAAAGLRGLASLLVDAVVEQQAGALRSLEQQLEQQQLPVLEELRAALPAGSRQQQQAGGADGAPAGAEGPGGSEQQQQQQQQQRVGADGAGAEGAGGDGHAGAHDRAPAPAAAAAGTAGASREDSPGPAAGEAAMAADVPTDMDLDEDSGDDGAAAAAGVGAGGAAAAAAAAAGVPLAMGRTKRAVAAGVLTAAATSGATAATAAGQVQQILVEVEVSQQRQAALRLVLTALQQLRQLVKLQPQTLHSSQKVATERLKAQMQTAARLSAWAAGVSLQALALGSTAAAVQFLDTLISRVRQLEQGRALQQMVQGGVVAVPGAGAGAGGADAGTGGGTDAGDGGDGAVAVAGADPMEVITSTAAATVAAGAAGAGVGSAPAPAASMQPPPAGADTPAVLLAAPRSTAPQAAIPLAAAAAEAAQGLDVRQAATAVAPEGAAAATATFRPHQTAAAALAAVPPAAAPAAASAAVTTLARPSGSSSTPSRVKAIPFAPREGALDLQHPAALSQHPPPCLQEHHLQQQQQHQVQQPSRVSNFQLVPQQQQGPGPASKHSAGQEQQQPAPQRRDGLDLS